MIAGMVVAALLVTLIGILIYGNLRWSGRSGELVWRLSEDDAVAPGSSPEVYQTNEIDNLPPPVKRYFQKALTNGQPIISGVTLRQSGTFNMGREEDQWKRFTAEQTVAPGHPGFLWDARIKMLPLLPAYVRDAYLDGGGILHGALYGLITVTEARDTKEVAQGEFLRYLAEAAWYPTALLPSQGAVWESVDDTSARVTVTDRSPSHGVITATMLYRFNEEGLIESVFAEERGREVDGEFVPTPWEGRWWSYEERGGMLVPTEGEVAWLLPERRKAYWRGRVEKIDFTGGEGAP